MNVLLFGDRKEKLPPNWHDETIVSLAGDADLDGSAGTGANPSVTFVGLFGDLRLKVSSGSRIHVVGGTLFGDRRLEVAPGEGPDIHLNAYCLFCDVTVYDDDASLGIK
jgi:hypothetical protein